MTLNKDVVMKLIDYMIKLGSELTSKKFIVIVLNNQLIENKKEYDFLDFISVKDDGVYIDDNINQVSKETLVIPLNKILNYLFLNTSKEVLKNLMAPEDAKEFKSYGLKI